MQFKVKKRRTADLAIFKPRGLMASRNDINKKLFLQRRIEKDMLAAKHFAAAMVKLGFGWKPDTVYRVTKNERAITLAEARAMAEILECSVDELFPALTEDNKKSKLGTAITS